MNEAVSNTPDEPRYAGFWIRTAASLIDTVWVLAVIGLLFWIFIGEDVLGLSDSAKGGFGLLITDVIPAVIVIVLWVYRSATPGKEVLKLKIVDARTLGHPSKGKLIGRYLGYYISAIPLCLGIIWVAFDKRKQGWHDKLAGTLVIYTD